MRGYNKTNDFSLKYMTLTGRWTDKQNKEGYFSPISQLEASIESRRLELTALTTPNVSGVSSANIALREYYNKTSSISNTIIRYNGVRTRVLSILHTFVSNIYYEKELEHLAESIFENYKNEVDTLISELCSDVLQQIPSVVNRLSEGDQESISQALTTVRRIIDSFADTIFPPTDEIVEIGGNQISLGANRHLNRLNAYVHQRVESKSRKDKIRQNLANLYGRVSTGVHADVSVEEAQSLFLNCYLLLGEILHIDILKRVDTQ
jgi:hypothetical protein